MSASAPKKSEEENDAFWTKFKKKFLKGKNSFEVEPITNEQATKQEVDEEQNKEPLTIANVDQDKLKKSEKKIGKFWKKGKSKKPFAPLPPSKTKESLDIQTNGSNLILEKEKPVIDVAEPNSSKLITSTDPSKFDSSMEPLKGPNSANALQISASENSESDKKEGCDTPTEKIDLLIRQAQQLNSGIDEYSLTSSESDYFRIDSELTDIMIQLDSIDAVSSDIKNRRKDGIRIIQEALSKLDKCKASSEIKYKL